MAPNKSVSGSSLKPLRVYWKSGLLLLLLVFFFFFSPFGFISSCGDARFFCFYLFFIFWGGKDASWTQIVLEAVAGFVFQTALSSPHRISCPECGYAAGYGQHHHPPGRHGHHKVRLNFPPHPPQPPGSLIISISILLLQQAAVEDSACLFWCRFPPTSVPYMYENSPTRK